jgi:phage protein D
MDIGAVFLTLAILTLVVMFLAQPYLEKRTKIVSAEELEHSTLLAERDRYINALKELDFDHEMGKIPAEDYPVQRADLLKKGAEALRQLDEYEGAKSTSAEDRLEAVIAARRADAVGTQEPAPSTDDDLEAMIAARRSKRKAKSAGFCPNCGHPIMANDKFCTNCGKKTK